MPLPCEVAASSIVPAIKAKIARRLKREGMKQKEIAKVLGVTESAVSQYLSKKRAVKGIKKFKAERMEEICKICKSCSMSK